MNPRALRLLHLDPDLVAIDKPAGLLVHPSALDAHEERTRERASRPAHCAGRKLESDPNYFQWLGCSGCGCMRRGWRCRAPARRWKSAHRAGRSGDALLQYVR